MVIKGQRVASSSRDGGLVRTVSASATENGPLAAEEQNSADAPKDAIPFAQRIACTITEACQATGLGRTKLYELIAEGQVDTTTIGRRRLVQVRSLFRLCEPKNTQADPKTRNVGSCGSV